MPIDRSRPRARQLCLAFAVLPHSDPASTATDPVFSSDGGPGVSNLGPDSRGFQQFIAGDLTEQRDLIVVDHRGTGSSGAIDCPNLQGIIGDFTVEPNDIVRAIGQCGRQLGADADRYGSGDVAMDLDAVRRALGYDQINLYGLSYAGAFLSAYATRYPEHLRAVVIDAGVPTTDPGHAWTWGEDVPPAFAAAVALDAAGRPPALPPSQQPRRRLPDSPPRCADTRSAAGWAFPASAYATSTSTSSTSARSRATCSTRGARRCGDRLGPRGQRSTASAGRRAPARTFRAYRSSVRLRR